MEGDVNTKHSITPDIIAIVTSGVHLTARQMVVSRLTFRGACTDQIGGACTEALGGGRVGLGPDRFDRPAGIEAFRILREEREPTFYQGFWEPLLRSVLRGGIAYAKGLVGFRRGPGETWMLTLESCSPREHGRCVCRTCASSIPASFSYFFKYRVGSYTSWRFHIASAVAAIFLAMVTLARFGFVPCERSRS
jgi:hypothetical protein